MPLEPTSVPVADGPTPPGYVPPVTPPSAPPPRGLLARLRARRAGARDAAFGKGVTVEVGEAGAIEFGDGCAIGAGSRLLVRAGTVRIGRNAVLGERVTLTAHAGIDVGDGAVLGDEAVVVDFDHRFDDSDTPIRLQGIVDTPVVIGACARIGARAAIQRGVTVGERAEVAAQSVVTRDVAPGGRAGGVPARPSLSRSARSGTPGGSRSPRDR